MTHVFARPFESFVAAARARPQIWRLGIGIGLCAAVYIGLSLGIVYGLWWVIGTGEQEAWIGAVSRAETPRAMFVLLATFVAMGLGPMLAVRLLHRRGVATLFGRAPLVIRHFVQAGLIVAVIYTPVLVYWFWRFDGVPNLEPMLWLTLLPVALLGVAIQTGAEEVLFRGYLQQQLAARFRAPVIWMGLPSILFGFAHYDPATAGGTAWVLVVATGLFGLVAADLTRVTGSLGAAWGFHFANNVAALLILAVSGTIPGLALYRTPYSAKDVEILTPLLALDLAALAVGWFVMRRMLSR